MAAGLAAAGIAAAGNLIGSYINNNMNQASINAQNAYNRPLEQVGRLKAAGLNPNFFSGSFDAGNQMSYSQSNGLIGLGDNIVNAYNLTSQTASNVGLQSAQQKAQEIENIFNSDTLSDREKIVEYERIISHEQANQEVINTVYLEREKQQELLLSQSQTHLNNANAEKAKQEAELTKKNVDSFETRFYNEMALISSQIKVNNSQVTLNNAQAKKAYKEMEKIDAEIEYIGKQMEKIGYDEKYIDQCIQYMKDQVGIARANLKLTKQAMWINAGTKVLSAGVSALTFGLLK